MYRVFIYDSLNFHCFSKSDLGRHCGVTREKRKKKKKKKPKQKPGKNSVNKEFGRGLKDLGTLLVTRNKQAVTHTHAHTHTHQRKRKRMRRRTKKMRDSEKWRTPHRAIDKWKRSHLNIATNGPAAAIGSIGRKNVEKQIRNSSFSDRPQVGLDPEWVVTPVGIVTPSGS